jgi:hypothetical protein
MKTCKTDEDVNIIQALKDSVRAERRGNILIMID